jgi:hypothetical protein
LSELLDDPQVLSWEPKILFHAFDTFVASLQLEDAIDLSAAAGRIATGYVPALVGDGTGPNFRDAHFQDKRNREATLERVARDNRAIQEEFRQKAEEDAAGQAFLKWESEHGGGLDCDMSGFTPSNSSAFERWLLREQMEGAYAEEKAAMQNKLTELRSQVLVSQ